MPDLRNGAEYSFSNAKIVVGGVPVFGITDFSWKVSQAKENHYGAGSVDPISRSEGKKEYEGSLTMLASTAEKLRALTPATSSGMLTDLGLFTIIGAMVPTSDPTKAIAYEVSFAEFISDEVKGSEGDTGLQYTADLIFANIKRLP